MEFNVKISFNVDSTIQSRIERSKVLDNVIAKCEDIISEAIENEFLIMDVQATIFPYWKKEYHLEMIGKIEKAYTAGAVTFVEYYNAILSHLFNYIKLRYYISDDKAYDAAIDILYQYKQQTSNGIRQIMLLFFRTFVTSLTDDDFHENDIKTPEDDEE